MKKIISISIILICIIGTIYIKIQNNNITTTKTVDYNGTNLLISIDGNSATSLPTSGTYYLSSYTCNSKYTTITWDKDNHTLDVSNGTHKGRIACNLEFSSKMPLSNAEVGSYVSYTGNNGCPSGHCDGTNANYESDTSMGYCSSSDYKFITNGWRIAYTSEDTAYLISAGSPECLCTSSDGTTSSSSCSTYVSSSNYSTHLTNLDNAALTYCNTSYAYGGTCNSSSAWNIDDTDFQNITSNTISSCRGSHSNMSCGYNNDLIDNGSYYWFATYYSSYNIYQWDSSDSYINSTSSNSVYGIRPVLRLASTVYITGGSGTYSDPYTIANE